MANEPKGPYRKGDVAFGYIDLDTREAAIANAAWLAGRASRDRLREALIPFTNADLREILTGNAIGEDSPVFQRNKAMLRIKDFSKAYEALAEDEKGGR